MSTTQTVLPAATMNPELEAAIKAATSPEAIRAAVVAEAQKQSDAIRDVAAKTAEDAKKAEDAAAAAAAHAKEIKEYTRTVNIGGTEFEFTASDELGLERMVVQAYAVADAVKPKGEVHTQPVVAVDPAIAAAAAQKAEEAKALARVELETKFKRGEISTKDYIKQSGAMDEYLAEQGLSIDTLKKTVEQSQSTQFEQSWAQATDAFRNSPAGSDWPGGPENLNIIGLQVAAMGLVDAPDKVGALAAAYAEMKKNNLVVRKPVVSEADAAENAKAVLAVAADAGTHQTPGEIAAAAVAAERARVAAAAVVQTKTATSSSLFGRSSGTGATSDVVDPTKAAVIEIPKDAMPQEIMDAWKEAHRREGKDPNAAFSEQFRASRR